MQDSYYVVDWLFSQFLLLWNVIKAHWLLAVPVLTMILGNIIMLIRSSYDKS